MIGDDSSAAEWIDVSVSIHSGMIGFPGDPDVELRRVKEVERGDPATVSQLTFSSHTATHVDAPLHLLRGGAGVDAIPVGALIGRARILDLPEVEAITADDLRPHAITAGERVLLRTRNSRRCWTRDEFCADYAHLAVSAATLLGERQVRMVGIDYLSIGRRPTNVDVHRILLSAGVVIVEGLDLSRVGPGVYDVVCLPLKLQDCDGGPARVAVRRRS
ncbi:MAG TPA: cyclase family protein [Kofleriaceae bacterium]|nr:cyclase family protein [Kofleriaceae bacterium]